MVLTYCFVSPRFHLVSPLPREGPVEPQAVLVQGLPTKSLQSKNIHISHTMASRPNKQSHSTRHDSEGGNTERENCDDEFVRLTIKGKIDDILLRKAPVNLMNIFSEIGDRRKFVLIEGAPGSGKSTLALHICQEWAEGKLFQEFSILQSS